MIDEKKREEIARQIYLRHYGADDWGKAHELCRAECLESADQILSLIVADDQAVPEYKAVRAVNAWIALGRVLYKKAQQGMIKDGRFKGK